MVFQRGILSLSLCLILLALCSVSLSYHHLLHLYSRFVHDKIRYVSAYTRCVTGLRLSKRFWEYIPLQTITKPRHDDFLSLQPLYFYDESFILLKNSQYIYSFAESGNVICIIRSRYEYSDDKLVLTEKDFYFGGK